MLNEDKANAILIELESLKNTQKNIQTFYGSRLDRIESKMDSLDRIAIAVEIMTKQHNDTVKVMSKLENTMVGIHEEQIRQGERLETAQTQISEFREREEARMIDPTMILKKGLIKLILSLGLAIGLIYTIVQNVINFK